MIIRPKEREPNILGRCPNCICLGSEFVKELEIPRLVHFLFCNNHNGDTRKMILDNERELEGKAALDRVDVNGIDEWVINGDSFFRPYYARMKERAIQRGLI